VLKSRTIIAFIVLNAQATVTPTRPAFGIFGIFGHTATRTTLKRAHAAAVSLERIPDHRQRKKKG
jgi:hypothetical protein